MVMDSMINHIEQEARQRELDRLYEADGRADRSHPHHATYTGLVAGSTPLRIAPMAIEDAWKFQEGWAKDPHYDLDACCLLDLRARVEALEQRAATPEPAPAPAADRLKSLQEVMVEAFLSALPASEAIAYAAEIDAVANWLARSLPIDPVKLLRAEACRARRGAR